MTPNPHPTPAATGDRIESSDSGDTGTAPEPAAPAGGRGRWIPGAGVVAIILAALTLLALVAGQTLPERSGPPLENIAVERTVLEPGRIILTLRNVGPDPVTVAQVVVNDVFVAATGADDALGRFDSERIVLDYPWIAGQPYLVSLLTSTGLAIEHEIPAAAPTPTPGPRFFGLMALLGTYVGIIPVLLGMLLLPVLRRARPALVQFALAVTVGLLAFLAFDATAEGIELSTATGGAFGGPALVGVGATLSFLTLTGVDRYLRARRKRAGTADASALRLAAMIALGIGLHNLGEGLAIGSAYAVGELALGAFLVIGFTLHNTTEGLAIVAPLTRERTSVPALLGLGLLAGAPAVLGAVLGATVVNTDVSALLLGVGAGAIIQVIVQIAPTLRAGRAAAAPVVLAGIGAGLTLMYLTGLAVPA
ncbi:ZIP family metal transporter [Rhodococcus aetherivorans]|uniref:ZIP family metal transporter n=1 Tax=Rhodococcus aetherivorans TaxID=191292 RepID=UPI00294933A7|nr:ZIP family metal transporter [Rhodococcus aetherivorans]MDV6296898.1 ZIP family metal transporter [Rhodococcus aetherivorans]